MRTYRYLFLALIPEGFSNAFVTRNGKQVIRKRELSLASTLPTLEQVSQDPFMKQVQYGADLSNELLEENPSDNLKDLLQAQLSHSDGIRGFMVSYLTSESEEEVDLSTPNVPDILVEALREQVQSKPDDLIPLAFMNVIMPTAMSTMHQEKELQESSARTAKRGLCVLETLIDQHALIEDNAKAILAVATDQSKDEKKSNLLIKYWTEFFDKWGYEEVQKQDIAKSMKSFLKKRN